MARFHIPVAELVWVHINVSEGCENICSHSDILVDKDIEICVVESEGGEECES